MNRTSFNFLAGTILLGFCLAGCSGLSTHPAVSSRIEALLTASPEKPIEWTVYAVPGYEPKALTMDAIQATLIDLNGLNSARFMGQHSLHVADPSRNHEWTTEELFTLESSVVADRDRSIPRIVFMFINGEHRLGNDDVAGVAREEFAFVFRDSFDFFLASVGDIRPQNPGLAEIERAVAIHEMGHVLGLVNQEVPMLTPRLLPPDTDPCQCHSSQKDSVMHYTIGYGNATLEFLLKDGKQLPYQFNDADWRDLRTYQAELRKAATTSP